MSSSSLLRSLRSARLPLSVLPYQEKREKSVQRGCESVSIPKLGGRRAALKEMNQEWGVWGKSDKKNHQCSFSPEPGRLVSWLISTVVQTQLYAVLEDTGRGGTSACWDLAPAGATSSWPGTGVLTS
jgi:hypothetical protein